MSSAGNLTLGVDFEISTDKEKLNRLQVYQWLTTDTYWATSRTLETHEKAIDNSINFGAYRIGSGELLAYGRAVTDFATFAWVADIYVDRPVRNKGVATALMTAIREHLMAFGLRRIVLLTQDAHGLYKKVGFESLQHPERWMVYGAH